MENRNNKPLKQKLLFIQDVEQIIGRNRLTLRRWWSADKFPKPTKLNGTTLAWQTDVIEQWINLHTKVTPSSRPPEGKFLGEILAVSF